MGETYIVHSVTLRDVIARLEDFADGETIYAEAAKPAARAVVAVEPAGGGVPPEAVGLEYLLEVHVAKEAVDVWQRWRDDRTPTLDEKVVAIIYYAENDAWLRSSSRSSDY